MTEFEMITFLIKWLNLNAKEIMWYITLNICACVQIRYYPRHVQWGTVLGSFYVGKGSVYDQELIKSDVAV